jgi:hypothetical protein
MNNILKEKVAVVESSYSVVPTASCNGRNMTGNDGGEVGIKETVWIGPRNNRVQVHVSTQDRRETVAVCLKAHANVVYLMLFDGQRFVECRLAHLRFVWGF